LTPYFNGQLASTNLRVDVGHGVAVDWLDGGGIAALHANVSAFDTSSNQLSVALLALTSSSSELTESISRYFTHLHEYFAYLLGCSLYGNVADRYAGNTNMQHVHKYMRIGTVGEQYTNTQFVLAAASLGFDREAQGYIGRALEVLFSLRCSPPISVPSWAPPAPQAICQDVSRFETVRSGRYE